MVREESRIGPISGRNAVAARGGGGAGKFGRHGKYDAGAMGGAMAASVDITLARRLVVVVVMAGVFSSHAMVTCSGMVRRGDLLLPCGADADRHRPDGARRNQRDQEEEDDDLEVVKHAAIMTWVRQGGSLAQPSWASDASTPRQRRPTPAAKVLAACTGPQRKGPVPRHCSQFMLAVSGLP